MTNAAELLMVGVREQQAGRPDQAERMFRQALAIDPANVDAFTLLGGLAIQNGQLQAALDCFESAVRCDPHRAISHVNLGECQRRLGKLDAAVDSNRRAAQLEPELAGAHANLGQLLLQQGNFAAACESFRTLAALCPEDSRAHTLLGSALLKLQQPRDAELHFRHAQTIHPNMPRAQFNLGVALQAQSRWGEAVEAYRAAIAGSPADAEAYNNLGTALEKLRRHDDAEQQFRRAIALRPDLAAAHCNLAQVLEETGRLDEALAAAEHALELSPENALGLCNLANTLRSLGRLDEAIACYRRAIASDPTSDFLGSNLLYTLNYQPSYEPEAILAEHKAWARAHADPLTTAAPRLGNGRSPDRRLRVGYVSAQFWQHAVNFFFEPILAAHDSTAVEVFCYDNASPVDAATVRLRGLADHWREIGDADDAQAAALVRRDKIDILVDLCGHIAGNRLLTFARRPAPVQVTYLGYQNTTGMRAMDYRLTDAWADPSGTNDELYTERLVRMPRAFFCYQPSSDAPPLSPSPALANRCVTFGSFNNFDKVTPQALSLWAELLRALPRSRIVILAGVSGSLVERVHATFVEHGVAAERVTIAARRGHTEYLKLISDVDIALDPFPINGHTTTCDALWQGVPVVTLAGKTYAQRFGSSARHEPGVDRAGGRFARAVSGNCHGAGERPRRAGRAARLAA